MKHFLDWSAYKDAGMGDAYADIPKHGGDYAKAIAVCINSRQCEEHGKQVMCPSYRVTGDPNLSTGGRVRLLKAALGDDAHLQSLFSEDLVSAMDLCVSCKGCKRECENNVDMALIKAEYLAQRRARFGSSLRSLLFAHTPRWLHALPWLRFLIRWRNRSSLLSRLGEKLLGISADALLPEPQHPAKNSILKNAVSTNTESDIVLLADTFTRHFDPQIVDAAYEFLSRAGYRVTLLHAQGERPYCCGRTYLAQGMVEQARSECRRLVGALLPLVQAGKTVVGVEASCVLGLRDDAKALGLGEELETVAAGTLLFEEFIAREIKNKRLNLPSLGKPELPSFIHGHCHQKAVGALKSVRRVLKFIPEHEFTILDTGCCGMAGTFGLEAEHREVSKAIAADSLLPELKKAEEGTLVANGFSCRQQIKQLADRRALHLAELLRNSLGPVN